MRWAGQPPDRAHLQGAIRVAPSSLATGITTFLPILLPAIIVIGAGYYLLVVRKKK